MSRKTRYILLGIFLVSALMITPYVSESPDGLEASLESFEIDTGCTPAALDSPLPDYSIPFIQSSGLSLIFAGVVGTLLCFGAGIIVARIIKHRKAKSLAHHNE